LPKKTKQTKQAAQGGDEFVVIGGGTKLASLKWAPCADFSLKSLEHTGKKLSPYRPIQKGHAVILIEGGRRAYFAAYPPDLSGKKRARKKKKQLAEMGRGVDVAGTGRTSKRTFITESGRGIER